MGKKKKAPKLGLYEALIRSTGGFAYIVLVFAPNSETARWLALNRVADIHLIQPSTLRCVGDPELITEDFTRVRAIRSEYSDQ
jgi:hypothetical protein